jgi:hypothetical protein
MFSNICNIFVFEHNCEKFTDSSVCSRSWFVAVGNAELSNNVMYDESGSVCFQNLSFLLWILMFLWRDSIIRSFCSYGTSLLNT